jgi:hypothetical protein
MIAKVEAIKANEGRTFRVLPYNASLEMGLGEHNSSNSIVESGLEKGARFGTGKDRLRKVAAGYDGSRYWSRVYMASW